jgi:ribose 5-phosphate isomerase B
MAFKKISLGCDHAGFQMKDALMGYFKDKGIEVVNVGTDSADSCDYPEFAEKAARMVPAGEVHACVLVCGSGVGMSMAANKVAGIRAFVCNEPVSARMSRLHNNCNCICLGGRMIGLEMAKAILNAWLDTDFEGDRHQRRVEQLDAIITRNK